MDLTPQQIIQSLDWKQVTSSNVKAVAFSAQKLYVEFSNGGVYCYNCLLETYNELLKAPSVGKFLHSEIYPTDKGLKVI